MIDEISIKENNGSSYMRMPKTLLEKSASNIVNCLQHLQSLLSDTAC